MQTLPTPPVKAYDSSPFHLRFSAPARVALGAVVGGVVGVEWGFARAFYHLAFINPVAIFWESIIDRAVFWGLIGVAAGTLGGLLWGRVARAVLVFNVMALMGGLFGAGASYTFRPTIVPMMHQAMGIIIRDGDGYGLDASWVILGAIAIGVWGASGFPIFLIERSTRPSDDQP